MAPVLEPTYVNPCPRKKLPEIFPPNPMVMTGLGFPFISRKHGAMAFLTKVVFPTPGGPFKPNTIPYSELFNQFVTSFRINYFGCYIPYMTLSIFFFDSSK